MRAAPISMSKLARDGMSLSVELKITGVRWFRFRVWLGSLILRLAARVIGCGIEIKGP